jgi:heme/copper-type cytochrome/quinol oxidase subunit 4
VQDNLDLFTAQYQMLKNTHTFFAHGVSVPFLGGVSRDTLPSELSLTSVLYMVMPSFAAYVAGYVIKIFIAIVSFMLLSGELLDGRGEYYMPVTVITGFAYGILNLFPAFGIPFASIPLVIYLFIKTERTGRWYWYLLLFCYPFISYFSYFGLFICAYALVGLIWVSVVKRRFSLRMLTGLIAVSAGYVVFEYRLCSG